MGRNRAVAAAITGAWLAALHGLAPDRADRVQWLYLTVLPLAYGHLLGALVYSWGRPRAKGVLEAAFIAATLLTLFSLYLWLLHTGLRSLVLAPMLLVGVWHVVENDLAMARAYATGGRVGAPTTGPRDRRIIAGATALLAGLALLSADGHLYLGRWLGISTPELLNLEDLTAGVLLYHTVSWIVLFADRGRVTPRFVALHTAPFLVVAAGLVLAPVQAWVASPVFYVFWSLAHAFQTAGARRA